LPTELLRWEVTDEKLGRIVTYVRVPERTPRQRFAVLVVFPGRGEMLKGPERGARGWLDDYGLERAIARLRHPPLTLEDFGEIEPQRLEQHNQALALRPYQGAVIVMPFLPDVVGKDQVFWAGPVLSRFVERELAPRIASETPARDPGADWAIDGVSMGARAALAVGFSSPRRFGRVGGIQAALDEKELERFTNWAAQARSANPAQRLHLLTSSRDYFLGVNHVFHRMLERRSITHDFVNVLGGHNYSFNRGPGVLELLLYINSEY
jgi:hypothetical protein